jgi:splicing factor 3B subunit 3
MQETILARGKILELARPDENTGKMVTIYKTEVFGIIRKIEPFRLTGLTKDFIVLGTDAGRIVILEYDPEAGCFIKVHQETYGKTGVRRVVPGEYIASDPKGRAVMVSAVEKSKFVYILNRDSSNKMAISSPLEAHKPHAIVFDLVGVDVGYDNPLFACLELDYGDSDTDYAPVVTGEVQKTVTFYEMDLGLNHVVRKYQDTVDPTAHRLIQVPGAPEGPGGIIVCCENFIVYKKHDHEERFCPLPRRNDMEANRGLFIIAYATHKQKDLFFFILQSEKGDLYKVSLAHTSGDVHGIHVQYFDTILPCNDIVIFKNGYLFACSEFGNHCLYQFKGIGDNEENPIETYSTMEKDELITFNPRELVNL